MGVVKHGHAINGKESLAYRSWMAMTKRCRSKRGQRHWKYYNGRGIRVCRRWLGKSGFANFLADMGERPRGKTIDRLDSNGNYEPTNCRWATSFQQQENKRPRTLRTHCLRGHELTSANVYVRVNGRRQCLKCMRCAAASWAAKHPHYYRDWQRAHRV